MLIFTILQTVIKFGPPEHWPENAPPETKFIPYTEFYSFDILWNDYGYQNTNYAESAWILPVNPYAIQDGYSVIVGKISALKIWFLGVSNYEEYGEGDLVFESDISGEIGVSFHERSPYPASPFWVSHLLYYPGEYQISIRTRNKKPLSIVGIYYIPYVLPTKTNTPSYEFLTI
ncbi:hypothetical protein M9Y10_013752 [Tritrichomonas musculus]|uniref:Uncharacterized protein n=1 Tax=Tritrichomonas musculus TaxID=1915356 RepID=A0ABR2KYK5_9EUKA